MLTESIPDLNHGRLQGHALTFPNRECISQQKRKLLPLPIVDIFHWTLKRHNGNPLLAAGHRNSLAVTHVIKAFYKLFFQHCPSYNEIIAASHTQDALHFLGAAGRLVLEAHYTQRHTLRPWRLMERDMAVFISEQWMSTSLKGLTAPEVSSFNLWQSWQTLPSHSRHKHYELQAPDRCNIFAGRLLF